MTENRRWGLSKRARGCLRRLALVGCAILWIAYMPIHPHWPSCRDSRYSDTFIYMDARLSEVYRKALKFGLENNDLPHVEIAGYVIIPLNDWSDFDQDLKNASWFERAFLGWDSELWVNLNSDVAYLAVRRYMEEYDNPEMAHMYKRWSDTFGSSTPERRQLWCDMVRKAATPRPD